MWQKHSSNEEYYKTLESVVATLREVADDLSIRGNGAGRFVYARAIGRAIELSQADDGVWVEFWERDSLSPVSESTYDSYEAAMQGVTEWFTPDSS